MNWAIKVFVGADKRKQLSLPKDFISNLYLAFYTSKKYSITMVKLFKSILGIFKCKKDT